MNNRIAWSTQYNIGVPAVDKQHMRLVSILISLQEEVEKNADTCSNECVDLILDELENYAELHFETEEELMKSVKFPDLETHIVSHTFFREAVNDWKNRKDEKTQAELSIFLNEWLMEHILREDQEIKKYLQSKEDEK